MSETRPKTVVLHQFPGIGDLVWHIPYFRAIAEQSREGKVTVIAQPSTRARELLGHEIWIEEIIDHDRRPRRTEQRKGRHAGIAGIFRMAAELRERRFDRIVIFSHHANRGLMALAAGIPERLGYGSNWLQRQFLSAGPYIRPYRGPSVSVYKDATAFMLAQGFCAAPIVPKVHLPGTAIEAMRRLLSRLPRPLYAFAIGSSEPFKQWGQQRYALLADALVERGCGVLLLAGPAEEELAQAIVAGVAPQRRHAVLPATRNTVTESAAMLTLVDACIGNDTGMTNLAAACDRPSYVLLGNRPLLDHDPLMRMIRGASLDEISVDLVLSRLKEDGAPGFALNEQRPSAS